MEILAETLNGMPRTFSSNQFANKARKKGLTNQEIENGAVGTFLHRNAIQGNSKRMWTKNNPIVSIEGNHTEKSPKRTEVARDVQKRYLDALNIIHSTLKYTDSINLSLIIDEYKLSRSMYAPLKDGGIIATNGKVGSACRYRWVGRKPSLEMAIELYNRLNNTDKRPNERKEKDDKQITHKNKTTRKSYFWGLYVVETID
jgi:hypothetical protein